MPSPAHPWKPIFDTPGKTLVCGQAQSDQQNTLESLEENLALLGGEIKDQTMALCCVGALWLKADYFDRAHQIFQDIDNPTGSLWHGISHRREGDYGNCNYWLARCGNHPARIAIAQMLAESNSRNYPPGLIQSGVWDFRILNRMAESEKDNDPPSPLVLELQELEWRALFLWTLEKSI